MGKKKRLKKLYRRQLEEARKPTLGKLLRLFLKTFVLIMGLGLLMGVAVGFGLDVFQNFWAQIAVYTLGYVLAYRWLMREFRPPPPKL
ncbi:hypothetical protein [Marinithermus hydrothermalis]|uniref:Uncharacterized protein n=1 Tax=Marinithermus hydrothermalis (strain DSM 14884 / JCM 11576 / T1) TaxID=869210 RepID=F2NNF3_MARHT|nr:hypothetical protein [Marinithermus hydrothermalis]AEB10994.1 hypothetical protein Marky_0233 [Marinithermus hydrothermalis DSM 14884]